MEKRLIIILVVCMFVFCIFAGGAFSAVAKKSADNPKWTRHISEDFAPSETFRLPSSAAYGYPVSGIAYTVTCDSIYPDTSIGAYIVHDQIGTTWYDFQQNGSVGRMISVTNNGYAHSSWHYTNHMYPPGPRSVRYANEWPDHSFLTTVDTTDPGPGNYNSGYCNTTNLPDGTPIVIYHETAEGARASVITAAENEGSVNFSRHWDIPDYIDDAASLEPMFWPKAQPQYGMDTSTYYIHIVGTEGELAGGTLDKVAYERCYINPANSNQLICQTFQGGQTRTYTLNNNEIINTVNFPISSLSASCAISAVVAVSPVSRKVAIVWLTSADGVGCDYFSDVAYVESNNCGNEWIAGTPWPPTPIKITNYGTTGNERAFNDVSACYDYEDYLHIIYTTTGFDPAAPGYYQPGTARLYHWSNKPGTGTSFIASAIWGGTAPGSHNLNIAKIQLAAKDPIYHPGGDSTYLYATWSQFNQNDNNAANTYTNSELYGSGSFDGGGTWGKALNLTGTHTPGCAAGNCLSEHWSSLASNMYNGDLYLQYICDKDPGGAIMSEGTWTDNPVMKLVLPEWPISSCPRCCWYRIISPDNWNDPYVKIPPNGSKEFKIKIYSIGNEPLIWDASADNPCITGAYSGTLAPRDSTPPLTFTVSGTGACNGKFICGNVVINANVCGVQHTDYLLVRAVVANDYFECPVDPLTYDTLENSKLRLYTNANCEEWISDISTRPDSVFDVFFEESNFIATTQLTDTIVGRFFSQQITTKEARTGVRDKLYTCDVEWVAADFWFVSTKDIYIMPPVPACEQINTLRWYWWEESKHIAFFKPTAPELYQRIVIEYVTVKRKNPPTWWPNQPTFVNYPNTYIGVVADIDCPFDTGFENGMNKAGYDVAKDIAWQRGFDYTGAHPTYNSYYAAIALANGGRVGESIIPYGAYNVKSHTDLYPNHGWGWLDGRLYRLAADPLPADIVDGPSGPDSAVDRAQVFTARKINAGNDPNASISFTVVKTFSKDGETDLKATIDSARAIVVRQRILCGDCNGDGYVNVGDVVCFITHVYKSGPPLPCPSSRGDVNSSGGSPNLGDIVYLIAYLYKGGPAPVCFAGL